MRLKKIFLFLLCFIILLGSAGCEAFTRKFTRKSKKSEQAVQMVLVPEEYRSNLTKEELYRQYFLFWKSWHEELENALTQKSSLKKKTDCAQEALKNLINMKTMLVDGMQKNIDVYVNKTIELLAAIKSDIYGTNDSRNLQAAERIKMDIHKEFIYPKIKNYLK